MELIVEIPDSIFLSLNRTRQEIVQLLKLNSALELFKKHHITISQAASMAGISLYQFMDECRNKEISIIDYDEGELEQELEKLRKIG